MSIRDWAKGDVGESFDFAQMRGEVQPRQVQLVYPDGRPIQAAPPPEPTPQRPPPVPPPGAVAWSPPVQARPVVIPHQRAPQPHVPLAPVPETCQLVRPGPGCYEAILAGVPDFSKAAAEYTESQGLVHDGTDGMEIPGQPYEGKMRQWSPTTPRTYGGCDADGKKDLNRYLLEKHGVPLSEIRKV